MNDLMKAAAGVTILLFGLSLPMAWITHVFTCLHDERWGFLIAGALMVPVGIIHGYGLWFGWW